MDSKIDPILRTNPVLKGKDAERFLENLNNPKKIGIDELTDIQHSYNKLLAIAQFETKEVRDEAEQWLYDTYMERLEDLFIKVWQ